MKNWSVGDNGQSRWSTFCNYPNAKFNIWTETKVTFDRSKCGAHCLSVKHCTHFGYTLGGCWFKDMRGVPIVQTIEKMIPLCGFITVSNMTIIRRYKWHKNFFSWVINCLNYVHRKDKTSPNSELMGLLFCLHLEILASVNLIQPILGLHQKLTINFRKYIYIYICIVFDILIYYLLIGVFKRK